MENLTPQDFGTMFVERDYKRLIRALKEQEDAHLRLLAVDRLGLIGLYSDEIIEALEKAQKDSDPEVRRVAERSKNDILKALNDLEKFNAMVGRGKLNKGHGIVIDFRKK
jgi:hypothetical protein